jgi:hypothetical protein
MNNYILTSVVISVIYFIIKFIEMRFINKETTPVKEIFKNTVVVFLSSIIGGFLLEQFKINNIFENIKDVPNVFTNEPGF